MNVACLGALFTFSLVVACGGDEFTSGSDGSAASGGSSQSGATAGTTGSGGKSAGVAGQAQAGGPSGGAAQGGSGSAHGGDGGAMAGSPGEGGSAGAQAGSGGIGGAAQAGSSGEGGGAQGGSAGEAGSGQAGQSAQAGQAGATGQGGDTGQGGQGQGGDTGQAGQGGQTAQGGQGQAGQAGQTGCTLTSDCTAPPSGLCRQVICKEAQCIDVASPDGLLGDAAPGDCKATFCEGGAVVEKLSPLDGDDGNPCTVDTCGDGGPIHTPQAGLPCGNNHRCDASGACRSLAEIGCADGTREAFTDAAQFERVAGCDGAWAVPGIVTAPTEAGCGRQGGDDGPIPGGKGCAAFDLCALGWHICEGATELATLGASCQAAGAPLGSFYATNQPSQGFGQCDTTGYNDVFGCGAPAAGSLGMGCPPLDSFIGNGCAALNPGSPSSVPITGWTCSNGQPDNGAYIERQLVTKSKADGGGVLCCKDP